MKRPDIPDCHVIELGAATLQPIEFVPNPSCGHAIREPVWMRARLDGAEFVSDRPVGDECAACGDLVFRNGEPITLLEVDSEGADQ